LFERIDQQVLEPNKRGTNALIVLHSAQIYVRCAAFWVDASFMDRRFIRGRYCAVELFSLRRLDVVSHPITVTVSQWRRQIFVNGKAKVLTEIPTREKHFSSAQVALLFV